VTSIQRIHTKGGQPAAAQECSAGRQNAETSSSYEADYYFYAPGKRSSALTDWNSSAVEAVKEWKFRPYRLNGEPIAADL
jgi:hypothetical protein